MSEKKSSHPETLFPELVDVAVVAAAVDRGILDAAHLRTERVPEWPIQPHARPARLASRPIRGRRRQLELLSAG